MDVNEETDGGSSTNTDDATEGSFLSASHASMPSNVHSTNSFASLSSIHSARSTYDTSDYSEVSSLSNRRTASISDLPPEVILKICKYLPVKDIKSLSTVNKHLAFILGDTNLYEWWFTSTFNNNPPQFANEVTIDWPKAYFETKRADEIWQNPHKFTRRFVSPLIPVQTDCVALLKNGEICAAGSRDGAVALYDVNDLIHVNDNLWPPMCRRGNAHRAWVWNMDVFDEVLYSASWDLTVKSWDVNRTLTTLQIYHCDFAILDVTAGPNYISTALCDGTVMVFDPRVGESPVFRYKQHKNAVLSIDLHNDVIVSGCEDSVMCVFEVRTRKPLQRIVVKEHPNCNIAMRVSISDDGLYVVHHGGELYLYDPRTFVQKSCTKVLFRQVHAIERIPGGIVLASLDNVILPYTGVIHPVLHTDPSTPLNPVVCIDVGQPTDIKISNEVVAISGMYGINLWIPHDHPLSTNYMCG